jgi:hypothetical protein
MLEQKQQIYNLREVRIHALDIWVRIELHLQYHLFEFVLNEYYE